MDKSKNVNYGEKFLNINKVCAKHSFAEEGLSSMLSHSYTLRDSAVFGLG